MSATRLIVPGPGNKVMGKELRISEATVKTHLLHIFAKLGVGDRTAAATAAMERGDAAVHAMEAGFHRVRRAIRLPRPEGGL